MNVNTLRPRRLRRSAPLRAMIRENHLSLNDLIYPIFVVPGTNVQEEIPSMPGCYHLSVDKAVALAEDIRELGLTAIEVFGLPAYKDDIGSSAWDPESPVQRAMKPSNRPFPTWSSSATSASASIRATATAANCAAMKSITTRPWNS